MNSPRITYADISVKQMIEDWGHEKGLDVPDQIGLHMQERFSVIEVHIVEASDQGGFLILRMTTDRCSDPHEFALMDDGSLAW